MIQFKGKKGWNEEKLGSENCGKRENRKREEKWEDIVRDSHCYRLEMFLQRGDDSRETHGG